MNVNTCYSYSDVLNLLLKSIANPDLFLEPQPEQATQFKRFTKSLYKTSVKFPKNQTVSLKALPKLLIDGYDEEQIWQQLELENIPALKYFKDQIKELNPQSLVSTVVAENKSGNIAEALKSESEDSDGYAFDDDDDLGDDSDAFAEVEELEKPSTKKKPIIKKNRKLEPEVNDQFFKLSELEEFLKVEDLKAEREDNDVGSEESDDIDYFANISSDDVDEKDAGISDDEDEKEEDDFLSNEKKSSRDLMYEDFFDPPDAADEEVIQNGDVRSNVSPDRRTKKSRLEYDTRDYDPEENDIESERGESHFDKDEDSHSEDESARKSDSVSKTAFQKQQEKEQKRIREMEENLTKPKPWQLTGEVAASNRPQDSLMRQPTMFNVTAKQNIESTAELTARIEEIVKMAISNKAWNDVERKVKPKDEEMTYRRKEVQLDQTKSKKGLAEVYEEEYLKLKNKPEEKDDPRHLEIKKLMDALLPELNALFSHIPKPPVPEIKVVSNLPAITVEDVAPVGVSDAALLAPEEIKKKSMGAVKSQTEKTDTDKKRERRKKKLLQKFRQKKIEEKLKELAATNPSLAEKQEKLLAMKKLKQHKNTVIVKNDKLKKIKSSKDFFTRLEETVHSKMPKVVTKKKKPKG